MLNNENKKREILNYIMKDIEEEKIRKEKIENKAILIPSFLGAITLTLLNLDLFKILYSLLSNEPILKLIVMVIIAIAVIIILFNSYSILYNNIDLVSISELINRENINLEEDLYIQKLLDFYNKIQNYNNSNFKKFKIALGTFVGLLVLGVYSILFFSLHSDIAKFLILK